MKITNVYKLYLSNFLTGLVFWYGIEKLFMQSIGIDAVGVGTITACIIIFLVLFDIPSGLLADKWSRKGMLVVSAISLGLSSFILGSSHSFGPYLVGMLFYALYLVATSGTYGALMYDVLHQENRASSYSKVQGVAYGLFLAAAGIGNIASGFLASHFSYRFSFYITILSCVLNIVLLLTIREPKFHKKLEKERFLRQLHAASRTLFAHRLLQVLAVIVSLLTVAELFKLDFGQLYMLRYVTTQQVIGLLWAAYAFAMALGSFIAHRFHAKLPLLIAGASVPYVLMSIIDNGFSIALFMVQAVAAAALINQVETRIQDNTESAVRTSVLSVVSTIGRIVTIPASFLVGWLMRDYGALWVVRFVTGVLVIMLLYWLWSSRRLRAIANAQEAAADTHPLLL